MRTKVLMITVAAALSLGARPAVAHHSFAAEFDINKRVTLQGVLTKMEWINPHGWALCRCQRPGRTDPALVD